MGLGGYNGTVTINAGTGANAWAQTPAALHTYVTTGTAGTMATYANALIAAYATAKGSVASFAAGAVVAESASVIQTGNTPLGVVGTLDVAADNAEWLQTQIGYLKPSLRTADGKLKDSLLTPEGKLRQSLLLD
jgi:hypothetical protein